MSFVFSQSAAVDAQLGLGLEFDFTFHDTTTPVLKLTDLPSGHEWLVATPTIPDSITLNTPKGARTFPLDVGVRLNSQLVRSIIADFAQRLRNRGQPMTDAEAKEIFETALKVYFMRGGEMDKFIPNFTIEWI